MFTLKQLNYMYPLKIDLWDEAISLEKKRVIEIIDESDNDMTCRFCFPSLREAIYQTIMEERKKMHALAAEYLFSNSVKKGNIDSQEMTIHLLASEGLTNVMDLSTKSKRLIIAKQVTNGLQQNLNVFKKGVLGKFDEKGSIEK